MINFRYFNASLDNIIATLHTRIRIVIKIEELIWIGHLMLEPTE